METTKKNTRRHRNLFISEERLELLNTIKEMVKIELERKLRELKAPPHTGPSPNAFIEKTFRVIPGGTSNVRKGLDIDMS